MCYCEHCRENFKQPAGSTCRAPTNPQDPARARITSIWQQQRLFELWRLWDGEIRKINPDARYIPNAGGGALSELDMKSIGELAPTLFADRQARSGLMPPWANGKNGKEYRATMGTQADRRHLQRGRGRAVPLEGFGAERRGDPALGRWTASPTACGPGSPSSPARCTTGAGCSRSRSSTAGITATSATCATSGRWRAWPWSIRSRPRMFYGGEHARARRWRTTPWAITRR